MTEGQIELTLVERVKATVTDKPLGALVLTIQPWNGELLVTFDDDEEGTQVSISELMAAMPGMLQVIQDAEVDA